jgi:hypothetical protein
VASAREVRLVRFRQLARRQDRFQRADRHLVVTRRSAQRQLHAVQHIGLVRRLVRERVGLGDAVLHLAIVLRIHQRLDLGRVEQLEQFRADGIGLRRGGLGFLVLRRRAVHQGRRGVQAKGGQHHGKAGETELGH